MDVLTFIIIFALLAVVASLLFGLVSMGQGGRFDKKYGTGFMWARVGFQAGAVLLLLVALALRS
ncbi:hypothetical protein F3N42_03005 [Marinihelvus fidelis]|uniref:HIG1 domain-containing protein n=1 Tax=Marinihelvus fidelis TaxID=2613842 RepID=A0A5N0TGS8_9GAMM|nr:HIG1 domain-containing protein [Marinihelvus fidelis]KAA9133337.1 hypothetical protein F3N42_03005 [Marinihelvus fidelis]